jgi:hypothetical protein
LRENACKAAPLGELSNHVNTAACSNTQPTSDTTKLQKLTEAERKLLFDNQGCLKCRRFFIEHRSTNCPNNWPTAIRYRTLTQADVDRTHGGKGKGKVMVAVMDRNEALTLTPHPVTMVMGSMKELAAYMPANASSIIEHGDESISDNSVCTIAAILEPALEEGGSLMVIDPPLLVPHFRWACEVASGVVSAPMTVESMLDNSSELVLIDSMTADSLALKRR